MKEKQGNLSIDSENIFPIIKKWLYSDHDIFIRELVSNGCDAITKVKKLDVMGEITLPDDYKPQIKVVVSPEDKTISFTDNGIGPWPIPVGGKPPGASFTASGSAKAPLWSMITINSFPPNCFP